MQEPYQAGLFIFEVDFKTESMGKFTRSEDYMVT